MLTENLTTLDGSKTESYGEFVEAHRTELDKWFEQKFAECREKEDKAHVPSMTIIATKGTLDWAYPPFILASTAAALGWNVSMFFTFYGLDLLQKNLDLKVSPLGNPAMPMKMPAGPTWFKNINWNVPNVIASTIPTFENFATNMMKKTMKNNGVASVEELRELSLEAGVKMIACQMTVELFGYKQEAFIPEVTEWVGAASFLPISQKADVNLFI